MSPLSFLFQLFRTRRHKSPLRVETEGIRRNIAVMEERMCAIDNDFWNSGGTANCCHDCFSSGEYSRLWAGIERRQDRLRQIERKLAKAGAEK